MLRPPRLIVMAAALAVAVSGLAACGRDVPAASQVGTSTFAADEREPLPPLSGSTLDGQPMSVADLAGHVVVLNSWASWCEPCRQEAPAFVALSAAVDPADVAVVGLDVSDDPEAARSFAAEFNMPYPSIVDSSGSLLSSLPGVPPKAIPSTLIVDRNGRVAARIIGAADPAELSRIVADVVAERPPA